MEIKFSLSSVTENLLEGLDLKGINVLVILYLVAFGTKQAPRKTEHHMRVEYEQ